MISTPVLRALVTKRLGDANVLLYNRRYAAAVYIGGYALEIALKYRICKLMQFGRGFPENKMELAAYWISRKASLRHTIKELKEIKHHDLIKLLRYSGKQINIEKYFAAQWNQVKFWNPQIRYSNSIVTRQQAVDFLKCTRLLINEIL